MYHYGGEDALRGHHESLLLVVIWHLRRSSPNNPSERLPLPKPLIHRQRRCSLGIAQRYLRRNSGGERDVRTTEGKVPCELPTSGRLACFPTPRHPHMDNSRVDFYMRQQLC